MTTLLAERPITAAEFLALDPDPRGRDMELWDGRVEYMSLPAPLHGLLVSRVHGELDSFLRLHGLGLAIDHVAFRLTDLRVIGPDVALVTPDQLRQGVVEAAFEGAPVLAIEVVSPSDRVQRMSEKILGYFEAGSERVWVIDGRHRTVTVHRPGGDSHTYLRHGTLTSDDAGFAVAGFELTLEQIFESV